MSFSSLKKFKLSILSGALAAVFTSQKLAHQFFWNKEDPLKKQEALRVDSASVFTWGNGLYIPRPDWDRQFDNWSPKAIECSVSEEGVVSSEFKRFKEVVTKTTQGFGIDTAGKVWSFKLRNMPSFSDPKNPDNFVRLNDKQVSLDSALLSPKNLGFPSAAKRICTTKHFLWVLAENGDLFSLSLPSPSRQQTPGDTRFRRVSSVSPLRDIASGKDHLLMVDREGGLLAMGKDTKGQCAGGKDIRQSGSPQVSVKIQNPERVRFFEGMRVAKVFAKNNQSFVVTDDGSVFGFGSNKSMQLAHQDSFLDPQSPFPFFYKPVKFNQYLDKEECLLKDIVMGDEFTLFVCRHKVSGMNQVFGSGMNLLGQLGNGTTRHMQDFHKIDLLSDYEIDAKEGSRPLNIQKVSCGADHCLALMEADTLLVWGANQFGQIGNKKRSIVSSPLIVSGLGKRKVVDMKADGNCNYVLTE